MSQRPIAQAQPANTWPLTADSGVLQRKCACGGTPGPSGECEECRKKRGGLLQRSALTTQPRASIPPIVHDVLHSPGQPLDAATRAFMEPRFGHDFSKVRVHTDAWAAESAQAVRALAYTVNNRIVFNAGRFSPQSFDGQRLLAHELTHVIQQGSQASSLQTNLQIGLPDDTAEQQADRTAESIVQNLPVSGLLSAQPNVVRREEFKPWPGQIGTDVASTRSQEGSVIRERVLRTGAPNYGQLNPVLLEFDWSTCTLTSSMEINFVNPTEKSAQLSGARFTRLKNRLLEVANDKLNGWMKIQVGDNPACDVCRGKVIKINVVAREGSSSDAWSVELRKGTGRANASRIYEGGDNWFTALLGGVSDGTLWHEAGHIVLALPDEYPPEAGDLPRPADKINESDWSVMSSHDDYGRRAVMHPRHFSFMTAWLGRRYPDCNFDLMAEPFPLAIDILFAVTPSLGSKSGNLALLETIELAAGFSLEKKRRLRFLVGGYGSLLLAEDQESQSAFLAGVLLGLDYSTNRSKGGFGVRADLRLGGAYFTSGVPEDEKNRFLPNVGGSLTIGYAGPGGEIGVTGSAGKIFSPSQEDSPYFMLGIRFGVNL